MSTEPQPPPETVSQVPPMTTVEARQWTYREVAAVKRVSEQTVKRWVKNGMIPSPVYTGATARFTPEAVKTILEGVCQPGTFPVTPSLRREIGKKGGRPDLVKKKREREQAIAKAAKKPKRKPPQPKVKPTNGKPAKPHRRN